MRLVLRSCGVLTLRMIRVFLFLFFLFFLSSCAAERTIVLPDAASKSYGFVFFHDENFQELMVPGPNIYTPINLSDGCSSLNMGCDSWNLTVQREGVYMLDFHTSFSDGANREFHISIGVDGVAQHTECHSARKIGTGGDVGSMSGNCLLSLSPGDVVSLLVENEASSTSVFVMDSSFSVVKV